jgi:hypothetical protein
LEIQSETDIKALNINRLDRKLPGRFRIGTKVEKDRRKSLTRTATGYTFMSAIHSRAYCAARMCEPIRCFPHHIELGLTVDALVRFFKPAGPGTPEYGFSERQSASLNRHKVFFRRATACQDF